MVYGVYGKAAGTFRYEVSFAMSRQPRYEYPLYPKPIRFDKTSPLCIDVFRH